MQQITDWKALWKSLVEIKQESRLRSIETPAGGDIWQIKAREFDIRVKQRWQKPDTSRETVLSYLTPDCSILDIGAGTGAWAMLFAQHARQVTAVEPSPAMRAQLQARLDAHPDLRDRISLIAADAATFHLGRTYPAAFLSGTFDHFLDRAERRASLRNLARHLQRPSARRPRTGNHNLPGAVEVRR